MKCPKCQHENPPESTYCGKCATNLPGHVPSPKKSGAHPQDPGRPLVTETLETGREALATGTTFAGRYQIIEELGHGGMGKVYRALDRELNEEVALKLIRPEIASERKTLDRFRSELRTARRISHRNIGRMYELMDEKGTHFITMEYVPGEDLKSAIHRFGRLPVGKSLSIARQVAEGLAEAHRLGVVHRDLKPVEHHDRPGGQRPHPGFRHRPHARGEGDHGRGRDDRHAGVHAARAGRGPGRRPPLGHLLSRDHPVRNGDRPRSLRGRHAAGRGYEAQERSARRARRRSIPRSPTTSPASSFAAWRRTRPGDTRPPRSCWPISAPSRRGSRRRRGPQPESR